MAMQKAWDVAGITDHSDIGVRATITPGQERAEGPVGARVPGFNTARFLLAVTPQQPVNRDV